MTRREERAVTRSTDFPADFLWGVATAAYQIEGAWDTGGRGPSIWDTFSHTEGKTFEGASGDDAVEHYHRFAEDVALMADLGVNAYRFSISWSRLIPDGVGQVNGEGVDFYRKLCSALADHGITPAATLYHWDLPQALQDRGGWLSPDVVEWFASYAHVAKEALGDVVSLWATLNEPWCSAFLGHSAGEHAPGLQDPGASHLAAHHLVLAHHAAIRALRDTGHRDDDRLGIVLNLIPAWPATDSDADRAAADGVDAVQNRLFLESVLEGRYPDEVLRYQRELGVADQIDLDRLADSVEPIDYLGVNYYNINHVAHEPNAESMPAWPGPREATIVRPPGHLTDMDWGVEPHGLTWMLERVGARYPGLPLMVMENGAAYPDEVGDDGMVVDPLRVDYLAGHIAAVREAIEKGVEVTGYFVWSLLDNFEWARGYSKLFGIVRVDRSTMERFPKQSAHWYRSFLAS